MLFIHRSPSDKRKSDKNTVKAEGQSEIDGVVGKCISTFHFLSSNKL